MAELMRHVLLAVKVLRKQAPACNILLNNGKEAGQYVMHAHFHVIPRKKKDGISIEKWKRKKMPVSDFVQLSKTLKKEFLYPQNPK